MSMSPVTASVDFDTFTAKLEMQAGAMARAAAQTRQLTAASDESRWRRADLLWPLSAGPASSLKG